MGTEVTVMKRVQASCYALQKIAASPAMRREPVKHVLGDERVEQGSALLRDDLGHFCHGKLLAPLFIFDKNSASNRGSSGARVPMWIETKSADSSKKSSSDQIASFRSVSYGSTFGS